MATRKVYTCDCETDPFLNGRVPEPFVWGLYTENEYKVFYSTKEFVEYVAPRNILLYAHNGGKFDFIFLLPFIKNTKAQIINGRIVSMYLGNAELRDSFAIIPQALRTFGDKLDIEYWKLEREHRKTYMDEINVYLKQDCVGLYEAVIAYRKIAGTRKTIASNALAFSKKLGIDPGKSNFRFDSKFRNFYFGGRVECFQPGTHNGLYMLDIHSSYPYAMSFLHPFGCDYHRQNSLNGLTRDQINRSFIHLKCHSNGAFPMRKKGEGLCFPHEFNEFYITGWEYNCAKDFNLIKNEEIISCRFTDETITFKQYVDHWYEWKSTHSDKDEYGNKLDPVNYMIGKIMMNSLYGKLAQNPARYYDYVFVPAGTPVDAANGWQLHLEFADHEIHRRPSMWKWQRYDDIEWRAKKLYNNVATGASITGFARANLMRGMHTVGINNVIYCDTDSIYCKDTADISGIPQTDKLGDWEFEDHATMGHFAGKKLYGILLSNGKKKIASKGSKLAFEDLEQIIAGKTVTWKNDAPSFSIDGGAKFVHRRIRATSPLPIN